MSVICQSCKASQNVITEAIKNNHLECLQEAIKEKPVLIKQLDSEELTPAHHAAALGNVECLKELIKADVTSLEVRGEKGKPPAFGAALNGHAECLELIANTSIGSFKALSKQGSSIANITAFNCRVNCLEVIIKYAPELLENKETVFGYTAAHTACLMDVKRQNPISAEFIKTIGQFKPELLLIQDNEGNTPALWATINNLPMTLSEIAKIMPNSLEIRNYNGANPATVAKNNSFVECEKIIREAVGANGGIQKSKTKHVAKRIKARLKEDQAFKKTHLGTEEWSKGILKQFGVIARMRNTLGMLFGSGCFTLIICAVTFGLLVAIDADKTVKAYTVGIIAMLVIIWITPRALKVSKNEMKLFGDILSDQLGTVDYFSICSPYSGISTVNAIGVNVKTKMISVVSFASYVNKGSTITLSYYDVSKTKILAPGYTEHSAGTVGYSGTSMQGAMQAMMTQSTANQEAARRTAAEKAKAMKKTGLYFETADLDFPEVFVNMSYEDADRWMNLLSKLSKGDIVPTKEPEFFPRGRSF